MLDGELVGQRVRLVEVVDDVHLAVVAPGGAGDVAGRHARQQLLDVGDRLHGPSGSEVVISTAGESGPCSAWLSRSTATTNGSACSSATTRISVGPAKRSMPTSPKSCRLASAT